MRNAYLTREALLDVLTAHRPDLYPTRAAAEEHESA
jgi:hypothetical protein